MIEDKLTRDERIRLEALAQAVANSNSLTGHTPSPHSIIDKAKDFERYIRGEG